MTYRSSSPTHPHLRKYHIKWQKSASDLVPLRHLRSSKTTKTSIGDALLTGHIRSLIRLCLVMGCHSCLSPWRIFFVHFRRHKTSTALPDVAIFSVLSRLLRFLWIIFLVVLIVATIWNTIYWHLMKWIIWTNNEVHCNKCIFILIYIICFDSIIQLVESKTYFIESIL